ncbi:MAG: right-handed parallel beta-helix repeat-containing protein [Marinoscillum sp.]
MQLYFLVTILTFFAPQQPQATSEVHQQTCPSCDYTVVSNVIDGQKLNLQPGAIICLSAKVYDRLTFKNIIGTEEKPIIIRNCEGVAKIESNNAFGVKFQNSEHLIFSGDGTSDDEYGICITTEKGFYLTMEQFTTDFEISRVEIKGSSPMGQGDRAGFAGIAAKTSPYQDCDRFKDPERNDWIMKNISIHNNYIHDTGGEGLYIGHGFYKGRAEKKCYDGLKRFSHSIKGVRIYDNRIENVGFDGIQIKNADEDVKVFNNTIYNYGTRNENAHNEGLFIGEGTTGEFYGNIVDTGTGNGCQIQGLGNLDIHDNLFVNSQGNGIYASHGQFVVRLANGYFKIHNNTVINPGEIGLVFYNDAGGEKTFSNNLIFAATPTKKGCKATLTGNILSTKIPTTPGVQLKQAQSGICSDSIYSRMESHLSKEFK